jgi:hypothetical protein
MTPLRTRIASTRRPLPRRRFRPFVDPVEQRTLLSILSLSVNNTNDSGPGSLRQAILAASADTDPDGSLITFDSTIFSTPQTIVLGSTLMLSESAGPEVVQGPGASLLTISGHNTVEVFEINGGTTAMLSGVTLSDGLGSYGGAISNSGTVTITVSTIKDNVAENVGGAIYNERGQVTISGSTITSNSAQQGGAIYSGSIAGPGAGGTATITGSTVSDNSSTSQGGGIYNNGTMTITGSTVMGNSSTYPNYDVGGGIYNAAGLMLSDSIIANNSALGDVAEGGGIYDSGSLSATDTTISGNSATYGAGLIVAGTAAVTNCTFAENSARWNGGGIYNAGTMTMTGSSIVDNATPFSGGGIFNAGSQSMINCTVAGNSAGTGGGIHNGALLTVADSTIAYNIAGSYDPADNFFGGGGLENVHGQVATLVNTIVALNTGRSGADDIAGGALSSACASDLVGTDETGSLIDGTNGNLVGVTNPGLGALESNGGPTQTISLLAGSPAIDAGSNALIAIDPATGQPFANDQRGTGFSRIVDGVVDIGAFEFQASIFVLNPTAGGSLTVSGNASLKIPGALVVDSSATAALSAAGNARVSGSAIDVMGGVQRTGNATISPAPTVGVSVPDPIAGLSGPCTTGLTSYGSVSFTTGSHTLNPGIYSQIRVSGNASLTLSSGSGGFPAIYLIEGGGLTVTGNASITGNGVMIYNAGSNYPASGGNLGGFTLSGNGTFNLTAATSGTYAGILIFQSRENTRALSFSGTAMAGMNGIVYAANALLSLSGNASLANSLVVGMLNLSGNVSLTQTADGSNTASDDSTVANTLIAGNLSVYINNSAGLLNSDELARIQDAINAWDAILVPYNVAIAEVSDPAVANVVIDASTSSACGGAASGVLGCYDGPTGEITLVQGWNWYAGSDPAQIGPGQYDFETTVLHELGHALGLGHSPDPASPMYATLATAVAVRTVDTQDLNVPDPPEGADPQLAAGSWLGSLAGLAVPHAAPVAPFMVFRPAAVMPLPSSSSGPLSVLAGPSPSVAGPTGLRLGPEPTLAALAPRHDQGRELPTTGPQAGPMLDSTLTDLAANADRASDGVNGRADDVLIRTCGENAQDRFALGANRSHVALPAPRSRRAEIRVVGNDVLGRQLPAVPVSGMVLDELAVEAVGQTSGAAIVGGPGGGLAKLGATLIVAASWRHHWRFKGVTSRPSGRPRDRKKSE